MFNHWDSLKLLKNVNLLGSIKHDDLIDILDDSSLLVHPSLEETFGNTLIEAMARRLPVLGGENSGAVPYVLNYGKAGFLCNVSDSDDILLKMECVFNDSKGRNELINNASDLIQNKYIDKKVIYLHVELYKKYIITGFRK
jgi:glycosyltransferase involved in cell wall biosynthesis